MTNECRLVLEELERRKMTTTEVSIFLGVPSEEATRVLRALVMDCRVARLGPKWEKSEPVDTAVLSPERPRPKTWSDDQEERAIFWLKKHRIAMTPNEVAMVAEIPRKVVRNLLQHLVEIGVAEKRHSRCMMYRAKKWAERNGAQKKTEH